MALVKKKVYIKSDVALSMTTDGIPRTGFILDGYNQLTNTVKGYYKSEDEEGKEVYNEVIVIPNENVISIEEI